jgi:hypothetical protein
MHPVGPDRVQRFGRARLVADVLEAEILQRATDHNPLEIVGLPTLASGWIKIDGLIASSTTTKIMDPAFYAVLIERTSVYAAADLPFELCSQTNGSLWPLGPNGDN